MMNFFLFFSCKFFLHVTLLFLWYFYFNFPPFSYRAFSSSFYMITYTKLERKENIITSY